MKLAQSEPSATVRMTESVSSRARVGVVHRAPGADRARDDPEQRRQQRERARELGVEVEFFMRRGGVVNADAMQLEVRSGERSAPRPAATSAPTSVLRKLTPSLSSRPRRSSVAPTRLSSVVATKRRRPRRSRHPSSGVETGPARRGRRRRAERRGRRACPRATPRRRCRAAPARSVVIRKVRRPRALPISDDDGVGRGGGEGAGEGEREERRMVGRGGEERAGARRPRSSASALPGAAPAALLLRDPGRAPCARSRAWSPRCRGRRRRGAARSRASRRRPRSCVPSRKPGDGARDADAARRVGRRRRAPALTAAPIARRARRAPASANSSQRPWVSIRPEEQQRRRRAARRGCRRAPAAATRAARRTSAAAAAIASAKPVA